MGKLIVIEGLDGCGKSTQLELLPKTLGEEGIDTNSETEFLPVKSVKDLEMIHS